MRVTDGDISFGIWLIGDVNPQEQDRLAVPLDRRQPLRHNIWTPVLDVIQDRVFRQCRARVDDRRMYVRNAIESGKDKPKSTQEDWEGNAQSKVMELGKLIFQHNPFLVVCFGAFAFELSRRANCETPLEAHGSWTTTRLGDEFRGRITNFDVSKTTVLPLLHSRIAGGNYLEAHEQFCGYKEANYFEVAGTQIADKLIEHHDELKIWIP